MIFFAIAPSNPLFDVSLKMTLPAHQRPLAGFLMTAPAIDVKGLSERRRFAGSGKIMTVRAAPVFRRLIFQFFPVFKDMMAGVAVVYFGFFIVRFVPEHGPGPLGLCKDTVINGCHIFLSACGSQYVQGNQYRNKQVRQ
jgi:hypothetical protein